MKKLPKTMPSTPATIDHHSDSPRLGPTNPSAMLKKLKFGMNQKKPCLSAVPWRSSAEMKSMECDSIPELLAVV